MSRNEAKTNGPVVWSHVQKLCFCVCVWKPGSELGRECFGHKCKYANSSLKEESKQRNLINISQRLSSSMRYACINIYLFMSQQIYNEFTRMNYEVSTSQQDNRNLPYISKLVMSHIQTVHCLRISHTSETCNYKYSIRKNEDRFPNTIQTFPLLQVCVMVSRVTFVERSRELSWSKIAAFFARRK